MKKSIFTKTVVLLATIINVIFFYFLFKYKILPHTYRMAIAITIGIILCIFLYIGFIRKKNSNVLKAIIIIFLLLLSIGEITFLSYANKSIKTVSEINNKPVQDTNEMSFVVIKDSEIKSLADIGDKEIATA